MPSRLTEGLVRGVSYATIEAASLDHDAYVRELPSPSLGLSARGGGDMISDVDVDVAVMEMDMVSRLAREGSRFEAVPSHACRLRQALPFTI